MTQRDFAVWYVWICMIDEETEEERTALDALERDPRAILAAARLRAGPDALRIRKRPPYAVIGLVAACAAIAVFALVRTPEDPARVLQEMQGKLRPLEVALSDVPYAP